ncbi:hypothetical protein [cyanobacterium endosymbiont of Rhopalodia gibberula]|uniref:hypothetical protein n=1 Tax=cyanobacterium endosymbiont of Rhopalodia gibberula TaxID=1763363 RepID=UPI0015586B22|nr:hypothetical protein [cyanobacterium endosymbiont of Rhopalodia gibberula]
MSSIVITSATAASAIDHHSNNDTQDTCYSCVNDHRIPPCAGFSQDYSCLPNLGSNQRT